MAPTLIIIGLVLVGVVVLLHLVAALIQIAVPVGLLLIVIGVIWYLVDRARKR